MSSRFLIFISIVATFLTFSAYYIGNAFVSRFDWAAAHRHVIWLTMGVLVVIQVMGPYLYRIYPDRSNRLFIVHWLGYTALGVFTSMIFYTIAADTFLAVWQLVFPLEDTMNFERAVFLAVAAMVVATTVIGIFQASAGPRIYELNVAIKNLPEEFEGFRIVQVSDLHIGPTIGRSYANKIANVVNSLNPDAVALTGDFVDGTVSSLQESIAPLSKIQARNGIFYVPGNHEYYWGVQSWLEYFERTGAQVLLNRHVVIRKNGSELVIAGVPDLSAGHMIPSHGSDPSKAIDGAPANAVKILLAHQPGSYKAAVESGYDLQLSGHTHGGQFFPWSLVVGLFHKYSKGLNKHENMWIYVNRGAGYWGPPLRFAVPPEVTLLRLTTKTRRH